VYFRYIIQVHRNIDDHDDEYPDNYAYLKQ